MEHYQKLYSAGVGNSVVRTEVAPPLCLPGMQLFKPTTSYFSVSSFLCFVASSLYWLCLSAMDH